MHEKHSRVSYKLVLRGKIWHLKISTIVCGRRILVRESTHTEDRREAEEYAAKRFAQVVRDAEYRLDPDKLKELTIDAAFGLYWEEIGQEHANSADTFNKLSNLTKYFNPHLAFAHLTIDDVSAFVKAKRAEGRKQSTINRYLAMLSAIINLCKKRRVRVPDINVREFMRPEPFENVKYFDSWETIDKIIACAAEHAKPIFLFALYSGMRISRVLELKWQDIHGDVYLTKVKDKNYKGGRPVTKPLYPPLKQVLDTVPHCSEYVFTYKGQRIKSVKKAWRRAMERSGVPYQSLHTLRHTHATWFYEKTHDLKAVQRSLNHTSSRTTEKYAHLVDSANYNEYMSVFGTNSAQNPQNLH